MSDCISQSGRSKGCLGAKHAVRPFVRPTPGPGRGGGSSLMLGFEPQTGCSTHRGKNSLFPFYCRGPMATALQHHGQQPQNPHMWEKQGFTFLLICDHDTVMFNQMEGVYVSNNCGKGTRKLKKIVIWSISTWNRIFERGIMWEAIVQSFLFSTALKHAAHLV